MERILKEIGKISDRNRAKSKEKFYVTISNLAIGSHTALVSPKSHTKIILDIVKQMKKHGLITMSYSFMEAFHGIGNLETHVVVTRQNVKDSLVK